MAPEQLEGKEADARTDIFALGEVIYETATGKPAFGGNSRASLIAAILTNDPPPISALQPMTPPLTDSVGEFLRIGHRPVSESEDFELQLSGYFTRFRELICRIDPRGTGHSVERYRRKMCARFFTMTTRIGSKSALPDACYRSLSSYNEEPLLPRTLVWH